jgi:ribosome-binding ATPase
MKAALIGMTQSGKSMLLSAISSREWRASTAVEEAIVPVPDERLGFLTELYKPKKTVMATIDCLDLPGLSFADDSSRAAARRLIQEARKVDMFVLVVRAFEDDAVPPYRETVDAARDVAELQQELLLTDLELVCTRIDKLEKQLQKSTKTQLQDQAELALHQKLLPALESGKPANTVTLNESESEICRAFGMFTTKPIMVVANVGEESVGKKINLSSAVDTAVPVLSLSAKIEQELSQLDAQSRDEFMRELGIERPAAHRFVQSCYDAMGLISFLTVGEDEVRAWPLRRHSTALDAAGKIHTDIKRGFIRAEVFNYHELKEFGEEKALRAAGKLRLEGKTYVVQDGDIINFRFNV